MFGLACCCWGESLENGACLDWLVAAGALLPGRYIMEVEAAHLLSSNEGDDGKADGAGQLHVPRLVACVVVLLPAALGHGEVVHVRLLLQRHVLVRLPVGRDATHAPHSLLARNASGGPDNGN